jgi:hypothetical protein
MTAARSAALFEISNRRPVVLRANASQPGAGRNLDHRQKRELAFAKWRRLGFGRRGDNGHRRKTHYFGLGAHVSGSALMGSSEPAAARIEKLAVSPEII